MNYKIINSGSDGNGMIIEDTILIDCGISFKKLNEYYKRLEIVLLTHIHGDHFNKKTISKLAIERPKLIYATDTNRIDHIIAKNYDYYFIEGNYESEEELHERADNEYYENRVRNTHLSKVKTTEWLINNMGNNSEYVFMHEHKERNKNEIRTGKDR